MNAEETLNKKKRTVSILFGGAQKAGKIATLATGVSQCLPPKIIGHDLFSNSKKDQLSKFLRLTSVVQKNSGMKLLQCNCLY